MTLLKVHAAMGLIMVAQSFHQVQPPELVYDDYLPEFTTIVTLCFEIIEMVNGCETSIKCASLRFDIGVLPALAATGLS